MTTTTETRALPILFAGPMVRATWAGLKTNTRRVINPQPKHIEWFEHQKGWCGSFGEDAGSHNNPHRMVRCPYGKPGDRLWVRETWLELDSHHWHYLSKPKAALVEFGGRTLRNCVAYKADCNSADSDRCRIELGYTKWTPSIHMPRWASRLTLDVTDVRVERLQDISEEDALAEGFMRLPATGRVVLSRGGQYFGNSWPTARDAFRELWDSINNTRGYSWESNPWVWAVPFKRQQEQTQ